jgi:hypothetical protein
VRSLLLPKDQDPSTSVLGKFKQARTVTSILVPHLTSDINSTDQQGQQQQAGAAFAAAAV